MLRDVNVQANNGNHPPMGAHSDHPELTFPYDTMGMKKN